MNQASIFGTWQSDFGPVEFVGSNESFAGSWNQGNGRIGQILVGTFDPGTRILSFTYQNWDGASGKANMTLSTDGRHNQEVERLARQNIVSAPQFDQES